MAKGPQTAEERMSDGMIVRSGETVIWDGEAAQNPDLKPFTWWPAPPDDQDIDYPQTEDIDHPKLKPGQRMKDGKPYPHYSKP